MVGYLGAAHDAIYGRDVARRTLAAAKARLVKIEAAAAKADTIALDLRFAEGIIAWGKLREYMLEERMIDHALVESAVLSALLLARLAPRRALFSSSPRAPPASQELVRRLRAYLGPKVVAPDALITPSSFAAGDGERQGGQAAQAGLGRRRAALVVDRSAKPLAVLAKLLAERGPGRRPPCLSAPPLLSY